MKNKIAQCLLLTAGIVFFTYGISFSQTVTDSFFQKKKLEIGIYNFNYLRDYEYFSPIMEGYTLYGTIVQPTVTFHPSEHVSLQGGVFVQDNFGDDSLRVRPTFLLMLKSKHTEFNFGNYRSEGYDLIEPLYFTDNLITENLDNGFILTQKFSRIKIIQWLDWERAIKKGSDFQERVWGGATLNFTPKKKGDKEAIQFPMQIYLQHTGGQINQADTSFYVRTLLNAAAGIKSETLNSIQSLFSQFGIEAYYCYYKNFSPSASLSFNDGNGIWVSSYLRINLNKLRKPLNDFKLTASYWQGNNFISPNGNPLMQSVTSVYPDSRYTESERKLFFLALKYENEIEKKVKLDFSFEPYYDLKNKLLEYGIHLQLIFPIPLNRIHYSSVIVEPRF